MSHILLDRTRVHLPEPVEDLETFRRWVHSDEFPEKGRISFFAGEVWVDMSKEQFAHNQVKGEVSSVLTPLARDAPLGRFFPDGYLLTNVEAELSTNPDGIFASLSSLQSGRVRLVAGAEEGFVELEGAPDMTLEVVSPSSEEKDLVVLRDLYWRANVTEYWLIDVRGGGLAFAILRRGVRGYTRVKAKDGWLRSRVFGRSFRLTASSDTLGYPEYRLDVREEPAPPS